MYSRGQFHYISNECQSVAQMNETNKYHDFIEIIELN